jgi:hypothetical protein
MIWNERSADWRLQGSSSDLNSWLTYSIALPLLSNVAHRLNITIICCLHCRVNAKYHLKRKTWVEVGGGKATGRTYTHPQNPQQSLATSWGVAQLDFRSVFVKLPQRSSQCPLCKVIYPGVHLSV